MPGISPINILGNLKFMASSIKLPSTEWQEPSGEEPTRHFGDSMQPADKVAVPTVIPNWFGSLHTNKYDQESADKVGQIMKDFHDDMTAAVQFALNMWKLQAKFQNFQIMAVVAIGTPGCLDGPELENLIKNSPTGAKYSSGNGQKWRDAVAKGVSKCFKDWQGQVTCPGLPLYPAFAAFPSAFAPPMPAIPIPLIAYISGMAASIMSPMMMKQEMINAFDGELKSKDKDKHYEAMFDAIATVLSLAFTIWLPTQMVNLVMGKGPIPTFAPPFVPVGPVMGGDILPVPGHLAG